MAFRLHPEWVEFLEKTGTSLRWFPEKGTLEEMRACIKGSGDYVFPEELDVKSYFIKSKDGTEIMVRWYTKKDSDTKSAVVYAHGGGMVMACVNSYDALMASYVMQSGVSFLSVEYRLCPEHTGGVNGEDMFAAVKWLADHADEMRIDPDRIAVMGDSGGGGVAALAAIHAREKGFKLAKQILIFPMLDDRDIEPDMLIEPLSSITYHNLTTCWKGVLGERLGTDDVSYYEVPARLKDYGNLCPAYIEVGELDILRKGSVKYATELWKAGVSAELHVHPGCPHGFDNIPSEVRVRAMADRIRVIKSL